MSTTSVTPGKRRTIEPNTRRHLIRVQVDDTTRERLDELSDQFQVARGTIAAGAIEAGLKTVAKRLRRATRSTTPTADGEPAGNQVTTAAEAAR